MASVIPPLPPKNQTMMTQNAPPPLPPKGRQSSAVASLSASNNNNTPQQTTQTKITLPITNTTSITKTTFSIQSTHQSSVHTSQKSSIPPPLPPKKSIQISPSEGSIVKSQSQPALSSSHSTGNLNPRPLPSISGRPLPNEEKLVLKAKFNTTREPRRSNLTSTSDSQQTFQEPPKPNPIPPSSIFAKPSPVSSATTSSAQHETLPKQPSSVPHSNPQPSKPPQASVEPTPLKSFKSFSAEDASSDFFSPDFTASNPLFANKCYEHIPATVDFTGYSTSPTNTRNRAMSVDSAVVPVGCVRDKSVTTPTWGNNIGYLGNSSFNTKMKGKAVTQPDTKESLAGASFTCEVTSAETIVDSSKRKEKFTVYTVLVRFTVPNTCKNPGEYTWRILRRYKQFFELDSKMRDFGIVISKNNHLPPKNKKDKFREEYIEYRRQRLEAYLGELRTWAWKVFADPRSTFQLLKFLAPVQYNDEKPPGFVLPFKLEPC